MCSAVLALAGFPGFLFLSKQLIEGGRGSKHALPPPPPRPRFLVRHVILPISHFPVTSGAV